MLYVSLLNEWMIFFFLRHHIDQWVVGSQEKIQSQNNPLVFSQGRVLSWPPWWATGYWLPQNLPGHIPKCISEPSSRKVKEDCFMYQFLSLHEGHHGVTDFFAFEGCLYSHRWLMSLSQRGPWWEIGEESTWVGPTWSWLQSAEPVATQ